MKNEPALLVYRGDLLEEALRRERVTREEVLQALRSQGVAAIEQAEAVVLETDGTFSVVTATGDTRPSALHGLQGWSRRAS